MLLLLSSPALAQPSQAQPSQPADELVRQSLVQRGFDPALLQGRYERRANRLTGVGGFFLSVGLATGATALAIGDDCDDDDFVCIPTGALLAIPAIAFTASGALMVGMGARNRKRARRFELGVGLSQLRLRIQFS